MSFKADKIISHGFMAVFMAVIHAAPAAHATTRTDMTYKDDRLEELIDLGPRCRAPASFDEDTIEPLDKAMNEIRSFLNKERLMDEFNIVMFGDPDELEDQGRNAYVIHQNLYRIDDVYRPATEGGQAFLKARPQNAWIASSAYHNYLQHLESTVSAEGAGYMKHALGETPIALSRFLEKHTDVFNNPACWTASPAGY